MLSRTKRGKPPKSVESLRWNCYDCGIVLQSYTVKEKILGDNGTKIFLCKKHYKLRFGKKVKLRKRH